MSRVLFVLKYRSNPYDYASSWGGDHTKPLSSGLFNSAKMVCDMLVDLKVPAKLVHVYDNNGIHAEIVKFAQQDGGWKPPTDVIIEAFWVVPEKFDELKRACPYVKRWIVRNHSHTPFLANEGMAFDWTLRYIRDDVLVGCNDPRMLSETRFLARHAFPHLNAREIERRVPFLPNYYPLPPKCTKKVDLTKMVLNVGCFGAVRPLKNHVMQAIAAIKLADKLEKRLHFHINGSRVEMQGSPILNNLRHLFSHYRRHELIEHPWLDHDEFKTLVGKMDLVMQVTLSETFNIVAADAITRGVPMITSRDVPWAADSLTASPRDVDDMVEAATRALAYNRFVPWYNPSLAGLARYDVKTQLAWLKLFTP